MSSPSPPQPASSRSGASLGVNLNPSSEGVLIVNVQRGTPAERMGLREGDRVTSINGEPVRSVNGFISQIRNMNPGDRIELRIVRDQNEDVIRGILESVARGEQPIRRQPVPRTEELARAEPVTRDAEPVRRAPERIPTPMPPHTTALIPRDFSNEPRTPGEREHDLFAQNNATRQTSFEDTATKSGDVDERVKRLEQQVDELTREIADLRATLGETRQAVRAEPRQRTEPKANPNERQYQRPRSTRLERWQTQDNRFQQENVTGAQLRSSQAAAARRADDAAAAQRQRAGLEQQPRGPNRGATESGPAARGAAERVPADLPPDPAAPNATDESKNVK
jgi:hypothetical protein